MVNLSTFDSLIASRSLLQHPFYVKWSKGELTLEDLRVYAKEYYHLAQRVPGIVERVRDRAQVERPDMVPMIEENITEETEHIELWERFANSLDISLEELQNYQPSATVRSAVDSLEETASESFAAGVAAVYALECELPAIAQTKKEGLCDFYNLTSEDAHCYFDEHLGEEKHLAVWRAVEVDPAIGEQATQRSVDAQNKVLDGVCEVAGIAC